jgi:hypothetical protein
MNRLNQRLKQCTLAALLALLSVSLANADQNSRERVRAFAKLPDWSGLWEQFNIGANGSPEDPAEDKAFHDSLFEHPPYNAVWEARYTAGHRTRAGQDAAVCNIGFPSLMIGTPLMFQAVVAPEQTTLIFSLRGETRHIYTDGRGHPPEDELFPTRMGDSVGHWEGQTLVVDTIATSSPANLVGEALSEKARYIERMRMVNKNLLEVQLTVEDPVALSRPWKVTRQYHRVPNMTRLIEVDCQGNDRNPIVDGKFTTIAPPKP